LRTANPLPFPLYVNGAWHETDRLPEACDPARQQDLAGVFRQASEEDAHSAATATEVANNIRVAREELFAPVLAVTRVYTDTNIMYLGY